MPNVEGNSGTGFTTSKEYLHSGKEKIELNSGYLPFDVPAEVRIATAQASLNPELAGPISGRGLLKLREAAAFDYQRRHGLSYSPDQVLITHGSSGALHVLLSRFNNADHPGNTLWTPAVGYDYANIARHSGLTNIARYPLTDGMPDVEQIESLIQETGGTNVFFINSPSNPTGKIVPPETLADLAEKLGEREDVLFVEDNVFSTCVYDGKKHSSMAPFAPDKTVVIDSTSKRAANWQVGWLIAPDWLYPDLLDIRESAGGVFPAAQYGAVRVLDGTCDVDVEHFRDELERKRDLMHTQLDKIPHVLAPRPDAAFFSFVDVRAYGTSSQVAEWLKRYGVHVTDGQKYVPPDELCTQIRISFAAADKDITEGIARMNSVLQVGLHEGALAPVSG